MLGICGWDLVLFGNSSWILDQNVGEIVRIGQNLSGVQIHANAWIAKLTKRQTGGFIVSWLALKLMHGFVMLRRHTEAENERLRVEMAERGLSNNTPTVPNVVMSFDANAVCRILLRIHQWHGF